MAPKSKKTKLNNGKGVPLGSKSTAKPVIDEAERALEDAVFGRSTTGRTVWDLAEEDLAKHDFYQDSPFDDDEELGETGLERVEDDNLFFVDVPTASTSKSAFTHNADSDVDEDSDDSDSRVAPRTAATSTIFKPSQNKRKPVWHDPADDDLSVSLKSVARLRKLREGKDEDVVGGLDYEGRLRKQFEKIHPAPSWATDARRKVLKKRGRKAAEGEDGSESDSESDEEERQNEIDDLFRTTNGSSQRKTSRKGVLLPGDIDIDRVRDANQADVASAPIVAIGFHPTAQVLFSATNDRRLRLFQIDGTENPLLQTLHVPELPISSSIYHPSGSTILLTGPRPFFISYNLQTGQAIRSPRGLLTTGLGGSDKETTGGSGGMERVAFSPTGEMLAVGGRRGYVHLIDWGASGSGGAGGQVVGEVKMNVAVKGMAWAKGGKELLTLGEDSEVYVWDVGERKCVTRWKDEGGFGASGLEIDKNEKYTAVSSSTGIVNVYDQASMVKTPGAERKAMKAVGNLTTAVTTMKFNHDSQILALASKTNKDALKLLHLPSATVFANWPTQATPLHHVTSVDFSKKSEWLAIGNARGKVLLYSLKSFRKGSR